MNMSRFIIRAQRISFAVLGLVIVLLAKHPVRANQGDWTVIDNPTTPGGVVQAVAISPSNPNRMYTLLSGRDGESVYRSDNGAQSWQLVYTDTVAVDELGVNPVDADLVYAGEEDGLYRSLDGGLSWTQTYTVGEVFEIVSPTLMYAGGHTAPGDEDCSGGYSGVARSMDGGSHWQMTSVGCLEHIEVMAVDPGNPAALYIGASGYGGQPIVLLYSQDSGTTWLPRLLSGLSMDRFHDLWIDPINSNRLYASTYGFSISTDGGQTWQQVIGLPYVPLEIAWSGGSLYAVPAWSTDVVEIYRSDDGGLSWWVSLDSLPTYADDLVADPDQPGTLFAGLHGYGIFKTINDGGAWVEQNNGINSPVPSVVSLTMASNNPRQIYAAADQPRGGVFYSENLGLTWSEVFSDSTMLAVETNTVTPTILYAGGEDGLFESRYGGQDWVHEIYTDEVQAIRAIETVPGSPNLAFAVGVIDSSGDLPQGVIFKRKPSSDFNTWGQWATFPDTRQLLSLAINPQNPDIVFIGGTSSDKSGIVYRSKDGGISWTKVLTVTMSVAINSLAIDPHRPDNIYAGSSYESVYHSLDGGETWEQWSSGLTFDAQDVYALAVDAVGVPYAGTGDGVYRWDAEQAQWTSFGLQGRRVYAMEFSADNPQTMIASTGDWLWRLELPLVRQIWLPLAVK